MNAKKRIEAVRRTFVDPFRVFRRNLLYFGTFLGVYGFGLMNTLAAYDLGTAGLGSIMAYFGPALLLAGFVYWPLLYMGFSAIDGLKWRTFIFTTQAVSLVILLNIPREPLLQGLAFGVTMAPFWTAYHIAMVQNTTKGNRGYEVSIGQLLFLIAGVCAVITTAHFLETKNNVLGSLIALSTLMCGTICLLASSKVVRQHSARHYIHECRAIVNQNPYMARRIISQSVFDMPSFTMASLMHIMGISPTKMAAIIVLRLILMFFLSPIIGTMAHKHRKHGYGMGLALVSVGWFILGLAPEYSVSFFICLMCFIIGMSFASSSLMAGLYEMQSYATMMWSEVFLAVGRGAGLLILTPLMFYDVRVYLFVLALLAAFIFLINKRWMTTYAQEQAEEGAQS